MQRGQRLARIAVEFAQGQDALEQFRRTQREAGIAISVIIASILLVLIMLIIALLRGAEKNTHLGIEPAVKNAVSRFQNPSAII